MANPIPNKPKKNHPWHNNVSSKVHDWAREESHIRNVTNVMAARPSTLSNKKEVYSHMGQI